MTDPMSDYRHREATQDLHVLLVESDKVELHRTGLRLLAEGCVVSTCQSPRDLCDVAERLQPDLILLDLVMPGVDLVVVLARCRANALPPIALHSKVLKRVLAAVVNLKDFVGVIRKTEDPASFQDEFLKVVDELEQRRAQAQATRSQAPAASGTHRIGEARDQLRKPRILRGA